MAKKKKVGGELRKKEDLISLLNAPVHFLEKTDSKTLIFVKTSLKDYYDSLKNCEIKPSTSSVGSKLTLSSTLPELIIENFDDEQIWQQIDLQNVEKLRNLKKDVENTTDFCTIFCRDNLESNESMEENGSGSDEDEEENLENFFEDGDAEEINDEESGQSENESESDKILMNNDDKKENETNDVEDKFLNIREMEAYLDAEDKKAMENNNQSKENIDEELELDYFASDDEEDDDEPEMDGRKCRYKGFFDPPNASAKKKVSFNVENENIEDDSALNGVNEDDDDETAEENEPKSSFEMRQVKLREKIKEMETENLSEKSWQLVGEISAKRRPENSLLEEHLFFEHTTKLPPIITQETTFSLEDVVKQRIKDKAWDDVERKVKPISDRNKYKNELILDQQKSKMSLSQIYEKEFLKQTQKETEETKNPQHDEIRTLMKNLFVKLDALTNYHYSPKIVAPEVKVVNNMKSIVMEEVAPVTVSEGDLLAPEEIKAKSRGDVKSREERSKTDKKREHRRKKEITKLKTKRKEEKEEKKQSYSKKVPKDKLKLLEKVGKIHKTKVDKTTSVTGKRSNNASSQNFFAELQSQKNTSQAAPAKKKMKTDSSSKALKL